MSFRILVPMDDSEAAAEALKFAIERHPDADITVLHVVAEPSSMWGGATSLALEDDIEEAIRKRAEDIFDRAHSIARESDRSIETMAAAGHPARAILNQAEAFDQIIMGPHGGSLIDNLIVGNVAATVFKRSPIPVTSVR